VSLGNGRASCSPFDCGRHARSAGCETPSGARNDVRVDRPRCGSAVRRARSCRYHGIPHAVSCARGRRVLL
jgi:hypothetical protein